MTSAQDVGEIEAIRQLKARYFRYLDTKQWGKWRALFTDDCTLPDSRYTNVDDLVATIAAERETAITAHHGHTSEIVVVGPGLARGIWAMSDYVEFREPPSTGRAAGYRGFAGSGHYEEEYRKVGDRWLISSMRLTRLRVDALVGDAPPRIQGYPSSGGDEWLPKPD